MAGHSETYWCRREPNGVLKSALFGPRNMKPQHVDLIPLQSLPWSEFSPWPTPQCWWHLQILDHLVVCLSRAPAGPLQSCICHFSPGPQVCRHILQKSKKCINTLLSPDDCKVDSNFKDNQIYCKHQGSIFNNHIHISENLIKQPYTYTRKSH